MQKISVNTRMSDFMRHYINLVENAMAGGWENIPDWADFPMVAQETLKAAFPDPEALERELGIGELDIEVDDTKKKWIKFRARNAAFKIYEFWWFAAGNTVFFKDMFTGDKKTLTSARGWLVGSIRIFKKLGVQRIELEAGDADGAFTWARLGFLPTDWLGFVRDYSLSYRVRESDYSEETKETFEEILNDPDPESIWELIEYDKEAARDLLSGTKWHGYLDLDSAKQKNKFITRLGENSEAI